MIFGDSASPGRPERQRSGRRVWDGFVRGIPDCWVVVARDDEGLDAWLEAESRALEATPLQVCRAVLDDDVLILQRDHEGVGR